MADEVVINITEVLEPVTVDIVQEVSEVTISVSQIGEQGIQGIQGEPGNTTLITVSEDVFVGDVINSDGSKADSDIVGKREWIVGVASADAFSGFSCTVVTIGDSENVSWTWNSGDVVYLNGTSLSTTPPSSGFIKRIGTAKNSTTIEVNIGQAILI